MDVLPALVLALMFICTTAQDTPKSCPPQISSCPPGMRLDTKYVQGCFDTVCVPDTCPYFKCRACDYGYKVNDDGCVGCECKPAPVSTTQDTPKSCPPQISSCPPGMRLDTKYVQGCFDTVCVPDSCPYVKCRACVYGYKVDKDGCVGCECKPAPVSTTTPNVPCIEISVYCKPRMKKDCKQVAGCPDCVCVPRRCPVLKCASCAHGYKLLPNGCRGCGCKPPPVCPLVKCSYCPYGYKMMSNGCRGCECNPTPDCPVYKCQPCKFGYEEIDGCPSCQCCQAVQCSRPCFLGYAKDKNGCQTCKCNRLYWLIQQFLKSFKTRIQWK